ncbi:hypothetical protein Mapa_005481 [Marchantia paleacea]|nr:hypothetical protein Mapa_005481 [Marchantia paleacea]
MSDGHAYSLRPHRHVSDPTILCSYAGSWNCSSKRVYRESVSSVMKHFVQVPFLLLAFCSQIAISSITRVSAVNFTFDEKYERCACNQNILCMQSTVNTSTGKDLWLLPPPENKTFITATKGAAVYFQLVDLISQSQMTLASIRTSFTFTTIPFQGVGDGFAFFMINTRSWEGGDGGTFGIFDRNGPLAEDTQIFAIEFDTYQNTYFNDTNNNHVGLDLKSPFSVVSRSFAAGALTNATNYAWIENDGRTESIEVRLSSAKERPPSALLKHTISLCSVFRATKSLWMGFSAASGDLVAAYKLSAWRFESFYTGGVTCTHRPTMPPSQAAPTQSMEPPMAHSSSSEGRTWIFILTVTITIAAFQLACTITICVVRITRICADNTGSHQDLKVRIPITFDYYELRKATYNFSDYARLGFGSVYQGILADSGAVVAIKRLKNHSDQGEVEFMSGVSTITQIRHRNIVELQGWCKHGGELLLVYDLIPKGSLDKVLFCEDGPVRSGPQQVKIVDGLARALEYLHEG